MQYSIIKPTRLQGDLPSLRASTVIAAAAAYIARGWAVVEVDAQSKKPKGGDGWQNRAFTQSEDLAKLKSNSNIGVMLGPISGGLVDIDLDCAEAITVSHFLLPPTSAIFGRQGKRYSHRLYMCPGLAEAVGKGAYPIKDPEKNISDSADKKAMILEVRCGGGGKAAQTAFPPSRHKDTGELIQWAENEGEPAFIEPAELGRCVDEAGAAALIARRWPPIGARHDAALALGGILARCGMQPRRAKLFAQAVAKAVGADREGAEDTMRCVRDAMAEYAAGTSKIYGYPHLVEILGDKTATKVASLLGFKASGSTGSKEAETAFDDQCAIIFAAEHAGDLRYVAEWSRWFEWRDGAWRRDTTLNVFHLIRRYLKTHKIKGSMNKMIGAVHGLVRHDRLIAATIGQWDADPWALNTPGGLVDLRTGRLKPHDSNAYCTKITAVTPGGECPLFKAFLSQIMREDENKIAYIQRFYGYSLTGDISEHMMFCGFGEGANGKGTLLHVIMGAMGDYARVTPIETFTESRSDRHPTELARLVGARLVVATETEKGRFWAESRLKELTGGDRIAARFMRQDFFEFFPQFKLAILGNHKPRLRSIGEAMRRRVSLLPFDLVIPKADRDPKLVDKLRAEWPGVLQWLIDGCLAWQMQGLNPPEAVIAATDEYFEDEDSIAQWIDERCERVKGFWQPSDLLWRSWRDWADKAGIHHGRQSEFKDSLGKRGFPHRRTERGKFFVGLRLRQDPPEWDENGGFFGRGG